MEQETFCKRPGTTDRGRDYENAVIAHLLLKFITNTNIKNFTLSSNDHQFGCFDDIVTEIQTQDHNFIKYALQLKHINAKKTLTLNALKDEKGNFSIQKYFKSFQHIKNTVAGYKMVLITNLKFDISEEVRIAIGDDSNIVVKISKTDADCILNTSRKIAHCYRFQLCESTSEEYDEFFENFLLYTDQSNIDQVTKCVSKTIQERFFCDSSVFDKFEKFITEWNLREGIKEKLTKKVIEEMLTLHLLATSIVPLSFGPTTEKAKILQVAISKFDITVIGNKSSETVRRLWGDSQKELQNTSEVNTLRLRYQTGFDSLNDEECTKLLWLMDKSPLIVSGSCTYAVISLSKHKKFVLINDGALEDLQNFTVFAKLADLVPHQDVFEKVKSQFVCTLPGGDITLGDLLVEDTEFGDFITTDVLIEMVEDSHLMLQEQEQLPTPYISRCLSKAIIDFEFLEAAGDYILIVVSHVAEEDEQLEEFQNFNLVNIKCYKSRKLDDDPKIRDIYISREEFTKNDLEQLLQITKLTEGHILKLADGKLEWITSVGGISNLESYRCDENHHDEEELCDCLNPINIISADPGMGKSILLKSLKNHLRTKYWTLIISPNEIPDTNFVEISKFEQKILELLIREGRIAFLWDAIDEISDEERQTVEDLIVQYSATVPVQWMTSRRHLVKGLERKFGVFSKEMISFQEEQQVRYMSERLNGLEKEDIIESIKANLSIASHIGILEIPLQIFMVTELFRQNSTKYQNLLQKLFSVADLYFYFVEEKFNLHYREKMNLSHEKQLLKIFKRNRIRNYQEVALRALFHDEFLLQLNLINDQMFLEEMEMGDCLGFITKVTECGTVQFVHNSYAEYFAATYLVDNCRHIACLGEILFEQKYTNVRFFFDAILAKNSPAHVAVLCKNFDYLKENEDTLFLRDLEGRNVLHLASSWSGRYPILTVDQQYILDDSISHGVQKQTGSAEILEYLVEKLDLEERDSLFHFDSILYAQKCECLLAIAIMEWKQQKGVLRTKNDSFICSMLYYGVKFGHEKIINLFDSLKYVETRDGNTLLHLASGSILEKLLLSDSYSRNVDFKNVNGETPLFLASKDGHNSDVALLLGHGANLDATNSRGWTPLFIASLRGHFEVVSTLIKSGAGVNIATQQNNVTPLYIASQNGHDAVVELLLKTEADVNISSSFGAKPLFIASQSGHHSVVALLLENGADVNATNTRGWTPLFVASLHGHADVVLTLIKKGASINAVTKQKNLTALAIASDCGYEVIVDLLLKAEADMNISAIMGVSPLHRASFHGHETIVELLVCGSVIDAVTTDGTTPLFLASKQGHEKIIDLLLSAGAGVHWATHDGMTALHAASQQNHKAVVTKLILSGSVIDTTTKLGMTALHLVCQNNENLEVAETLIKFGATVNITDDEGCSPLYVACLHGQEAIVHLLIRNGANIATADMTGVTSFHVACREGHQASVNLLLNTGADINSVTYDGETALYLACQEGYGSVVQVLLESGADYSVRNNRGWTPLFAASFNGHTDVVDSLIRRGADVNISTSSSNATPLLVASQEGFVEIVNMLIENGANVNLFNTDKVTPLYLASKYGYHRIVDALIRAGADVKCVTDDGDTSLHAASEYGFQTVMEMLIKFGSDVNAVNRDGHTAFYRAACNSCDDSAILLFRYGAQID